MSKTHQRSALIARAESLLQKKPYTQEDNALFNSLIRLSDAMILDGESSSTDEQRKASLRFRELLLSEKRTYTPLSTGADGQLIAQGFEANVKNLMIADGPLFAGSPLLTNFPAKNMAPSKTMAADDFTSTRVVQRADVRAGASAAAINSS